MILYKVYSLIKGYWVLWLQGFDSLLPGLPRQRCKGSALAADGRGQGRSLGVSAF